ncbi:MAG: hypothetical protein MZW92_22650 [Comamonadaceae bacterium]|nr:hypothetical protein [Comamonadaceae bacterium]
MVRAHVNGCTVADSNCLRFSPTMGAGGEPISRGRRPGQRGRRGDLGPARACRTPAGHRARAGARREPSPPCCRATR